MVCLLGSCQRELPGKRRSKLLARRFVRHPQQVGQRRLILEKDAELKQRRVTTPNLRQPDKFGAANHHLVRRQRAIARRK